MKCITHAHMYKHGDYKIRKNTKIRIGINSTNSTGLSELFKNVFVMKRHVIHSSWSIYKESKHITDMFTFLTLECFTVN